MAINTPTRDDVATWIASWKRAKNSPKFTTNLRDYIAKKLEGYEGADATVDTTGHDSLGDTTLVLDMIMMDLPSYGVTDAG